MAKFNHDPHLKRDISNVLFAIEEISMWLSFLFLFIPAFYAVQVGIVMILPWIAFLFAWSIRPSVFTLLNPDEEDLDYFHTDIPKYMVFPGLVMFVRALTDFQLEDWSDMILPTGIAFGVMSGFIVMTHRLPKRDGPKWFQKLAILCIPILLYSSGAVVQFNCGLHIQPFEFNKTILVKEIHHAGVDTTYYAWVDPWEGRDGTQMVPITKAEFQTKGIGDSLIVRDRTGLLGMPWFPAAPFD